MTTDERDIKSPPKGLGSGQGSGRKSNVNDDWVPCKESGYLYVVESDDLDNVIIETDHWVEIDDDELTECGGA